MDILHHDLKAIESLRFGSFHFSTKTLDEVLVDNAVRASKEGEHMEDKVSLAIGQLGKVSKILCKINFFGCPE